MPIAPFSREALLLCRRAEASAPTLHHAPPTTFGTQPHYPMMPANWGAIGQYNSRTGDYGVVLSDGATTKAIIGAVAVAVAVVARKR